MRYEFAKGCVLKTENAAKPGKQASMALNKYIAGLHPVQSSFDYGCGKLRYLNPILATTESLTLVDSEVQIDRRQIVHDELTTIRKVTKRSNRLSAVNTIEFSRDNQEFDRGFCINVLSVIPFSSARQNVVHLIHQKLRRGGTCLFVVQYRNSDFRRMRAMKNARPWRDGFIVNSLRGFSFYGLISPQRLERLVLSCGFEVADRILNDGRVFLLARSRAKPLEKIQVVNETGFKVRLSRDLPET